MSASNKRHRLCSPEGFLSIDAPCTTAGMEMLVKIRHDYPWWEHGKIHDYTPKDGDMLLGTVYITGRNADVGGTNTLPDTFNMAIGMRIMSKYNAKVSIHTQGFINLSPANIGIDAHCIQCLQTLGWIETADECWIYKPKGK
jgi:hypothetical protein